MCSYATAGNRPGALVAQHYKPLVITDITNHPLMLCALRLEITVCSLSRTRYWKTTTCTCMHSHTSRCAVSIGACNENRRAICTNTRNSLGVAEIAVIQTGQLSTDGLLMYNKANSVRLKHGSPRQRASCKSGYLLGTLETICTAYLSRDRTQLG